MMAGAGEHALTYIFYHPSMEGLANRIASDKAYSSRVRLGRIGWSSFADGFPNLKIDAEDAAAMTDSQCDVAFLAALDDPATLFEQLAVIYALPRMRAGNFKVFVPYFAVGTMERVDSFGQIATAATMARLLSAIPLCATGPSSVVIYDIHALQEQFYFADAVLVQLKSAAYVSLRETSPRDAIADRCIARAIHS